MGSALRPRQPSGGTREPAGATLSGSPDPRARTSATRPPPMRRLIIAALLLPAGSSLRCSFDAAGRYALRSGADPSIVLVGLPIAVSTEAGWSSAAPKAASAVPLARVRATNTSGVDEALGGAWHGQEVHWSAGGTPFVTGCRNYGSTVVLEYAFPAGATFSPAQPPGGLRTQFPAFTDASLRSRFPNTLSWEHDTMQPANRLTLGPSGGPTVLATPGFADVLVVSPLDHFMTSSALNSTFDGNLSAAAWGMAATVRSVPAGFRHRILVHEGKGLTQTVHEFGQLMQATSGGVSRVPDVTLARLGYSTDNGAMYCYCKQHCDTTLLQVKRAWDEAGIPMAYMTFEGSWFENNWSAMWWCVQQRSA